MAFPKTLLGFVAELFEPLFPVLLRRASPAEENKAQELVAGKTPVSTPQAGLFAEAIPMAQVARMAASSPLSFAGDTFECQKRTTLIVSMVSGDRKTYLYLAGAKIRVVAGMILLPPWEVEDAEQ